MKTVITNTATNTVITLNTEVSKMEQFRLATLEGLELGRSSFYLLVSGKVEESKGWKIEQQAEETQQEQPKMEDTKPMQLFGMNIIKEEQPQKDSSPRQRRDMDQVFSAARKSKFNSWLEALEDKGFQLVDVKKGLKKFRMNIPGVELGRKNPRIDISPLANGGVNITLYLENRSTKVKATLKSEEVNVQAIVKAATDKQFMSAAK